MVDDEVSFGAHLKRFRVRSGLTQEELAERAGLSARGISDLERGLRLAPHQDTVRMLADALALSPEDRARLARTIERRRVAARRTTPFAPPLPVPFTSFIGRESERVRLRDLLTRPAVRLVTLTGLGGAGKTRLALAVAGDLQARDPRTVSFVPLATLRDPDLLGGTILHALGGNEEPGQAPDATLRRILCAEPYVLILDNFEQIVEAAPLVSALLNDCPALTVLVTSRVPLRLAGEHIFSLAPLRADEAVDLFAARARASQPDSGQAPWDPETLAAICARLDHLPLALELAAPHVSLLPLQTLLQRLQQRLPLLTHGPRDAPKRQQDLRATIAWSFDLLPPESQALVRIVASFAGSATLEAIESVAASRGFDPAQVLAGMHSLSEHNLIQAIPEADGTPRFRMLELVQEYGQEQRAAAGETAGLRRAHAAYFADWSEQERPKLGGGDRLGALRQLDRERDNLRAALEWAREHRESMIGPRIVAAVSEYWWVRGSLREGNYWLITFREDARDAPDAIYSEVMYMAGSFAFSLGDQSRAAELGEELRARSEEVGDITGLGKALFLLSTFPRLQGRTEDAVTLLEEALALFRRADNPHWIALCQGILGVCALDLGDLKRAARLLEEALAICRRLGHGWGAALALALLGSVEAAAGNAGRSLSRFRESLSLFQQEQDPWRSATSLLRCTLPLVQAGNIAESVRLLAAAESLLGDLGVTLEVREQAVLQTVMSAARARLDAATIDALWEAGQQLSLAEAAAEVAVISLSPTRADAVG